MGIDRHGRPSECDTSRRAGARPRQLARSLAAAACFLLAGCGTNILVLIEEEGQLMWRGDQALAAADFEPDLQTPLYDAELEMQSSCKPINKAVTERRDTTVISIAAQFRTDLTLLTALFVPIPAVESCATAQADYRETLATLCQKLDEMGSQDTCSGDNLP